jgi:hypothetical protein
MYAPYVRNGSRGLRHGSTILDMEIVYNDVPSKLPRGWWLAPLFIIACGIAGWMTTLPLG